MRMHAGGRSHDVRILAREGERVPAARLAAARQDEELNACILCTLYDLCAIVVEAVVGEIGADVDGGRVHPNLCLGLTPAKEQGARRHEYDAHDHEGGEVAGNIGKSRAVEHDGACRVEDVGQREQPGDLPDPFLCAFQ